MRKNFIAAVMAAALTVSYLPNIARAQQEETPVNNAVSGYVSLKDGVKIAGNNRTPKIYYDSADYEGVIRAIGDLKDDLYSVTGKEAVLEVIDNIADDSASDGNISVSSFQLLSDSAPVIAKLDLEAGEMTVDNYQSLAYEARGIIAFYNSESNVLEKVFLSENKATAQNGSLTFSNVEDIENTDIKGFLWRDDDGLTCEPAAGVYIYNRNIPEITPLPSAIPTGEPTVKPTGEPIDKPTLEPTSEPTDEPTNEPTIEPTSEPTSEPTNKPTAEPTTKPTENPLKLEHGDVVIGTFGENSLIDEFAKSNEAIANMEGKWESFTIQEIDGSIVIAGSDRRGTIYGIYDLCEKIGVSPWSFWADVQPETAEELYINLPDGGYTEGEPSVKYRGIFPNDEYLLTTWSNEKLNIGTNMTSEKYEKVYELLLRLKLNTLWPVMHHYSTAFHKVNGTAQKADEYGIVIGSSHAEPLLRNNLGELYDFQQEWLARSENQDKTLLYQDSSGSYIKDDDGRNVAYIWTDKDNSGNAVANKEFLTDYWRESVKEYGEYENIYTLGMRGVHDTGFVTNMPSYTQAIAEVIAAQVDILEEVLQKDIDEIPTAFVAYKDVLEYYNRTGVKDSDGNEIVHLNIPESTVIMYCDDNFGYMRQTADEYERGTTGRAGVYYHLSYYGGPRSYLWLTSTQPGLIREELTKAHSTGSDKIWVVNVGDIKPAEKEIEYYARLARDVEGTNETDIAEIYAAEAKRDFNLSDSDAQVYAGIMDEYYALANSKRPEFYRASDTADGFNIAPFVYGDEAQRYLDRYNAIVAKAEILYEKLDDIKKDAFFETVLYPLRSSRNMAKNSLQTERANMSAEQGMGIASQRYAKEAEDAATQITADTKYYNETVADGKWNGIMALQPKWGADAVIYYDGCDAKVATRSDAKTLTELDYTDMAIAIGGKIADNPSINLSAYDSYAKYFDIVNTGYGSFDYAVTSDNEAIRLSKAEGTVYGSDRIYLTLDKSKATDNSQAAVTVTQLLDNHVINEKTITVSISYPNVTDMAGRAYYVESDGVVSVEAEHYSAANNNDSYQWIVEKDFGRSGDTVKAYPDTANDAADNTYQTSSAHLEYDIYFTEAGTYTLDLYRMPTLNEGTTKMRCAVGLDDSAPIRLGGTAAVDGNSKTNMWGKQVLVNSEKLTTTVTVSSVGKHTLKLYTVSTGFVADKIVLHRDNVYSYFGAPESYNSEYNNQIDMPNDAADIETDESGITKTFEPKAVIGAVTKATDKLTVPLYAISESLSEAVVVAASYDENGVMTSVDFKKVSFNEGEAQTELTLPADAENYAVTVIDGFTNMHLIAPYKSNGTIVTDAGSSYMKVATDLTEYESKKSAIIISDKAITENIQSADIAYFYGGAITNTLYKSIPFTDKGEYNVRVGIDGEEPIDEAVSTVVNIEPDNNGAKITEYEQSFDGYTLNISDWVLGTSCAKTNPNLTIETKSGDDKYLKLTQNNTQVAQTIGAYKIFDANDRVDIAANPNQTISADVMFGKMNGSGSWGTSQISIGSSSLAKSSAYFSSGEPDYGAASDSGHILLMQYEGGTGKLTINGQLIAEGSNNFADKWINVSADADFTNKTIDATVTIEGGEPVIFKDLQFYAENNINDIGSIYLRAAKPNGAVCIDNLEVYTTTAPQYAISINAVDSLENQIEGAVITVKDESGKTILSEASGDFAGKYMLTKGTYTISASAFGYSPVTDRELVLNERLDSKTVTIELEKLPVQQYTVTFDANGGKINGKDTDTVVVNGGETVTSITPTREHYSFVEWQLDGDAYNFETPVTGDITLTAVWEIDKVTVSFDAGTGADAFISTDASRQVDYNTAIGNPPTPNNIKANYAFAHWLSDQTTYSNDEVAALAVTQPLSFLAKYTITVTLDGNGGLFGSDETTTVSRLEGTTLGTVSEPEKTHYIFTGWKKGGVDVNDITTEVITAPVTYTAQWTHIERTVTFDLNGGEVDNSAENVDVKVNDGEKVTPPSVSRDGYTLKGWKKDNADFDLNTEITADITLVAEWEEIPANSYSVTFDLNGASVSVPAQTVQENNTVTEPSAPERTGYTFNGWQLNGSVYNFSTPVTGNITLTAQWTINQYDVKFMDGDTQLGETQSIDYNETAIVPPNPEKIGYTFGGWSTTENGTTAAQDIASNPVTSAVTYYAIWTPTEYTISYFDADGTTAINQEPANYTIETDDITLTAPTKEGYTFEGWYDNAAYNGDAITSIAKGSTGNKTFYAKWSKEDTSISYTVVPELVSDSDTSEGTTVLASGTVDEGTASVTVTGLPIVVKEADKYYILSTDASETFQRTLDLTGDKEQKLKVRYTLDETIIAYTELENLELGDETTSETSSGGKYGYVHSDGGTKIIASGIAAGTYSYTVSVSGKNAAGASWRFYLSSTEVNTWKNDNPTYPYSFTGNVTISSDGQLKIAPYKKDSTLYNSVDIDYIIVRDPNTVTDYTVKAVTPEGAAIAEITTGITKTASAVSGLPEVVQDSNNKYYRISDNLVAENSHTKNITKKLTAGDTINVEYTLDENIVYFVEGESFTSKKNFSDTIIAKSTMSGGNSAASTADYTLNGGAAFDAGNYNFEAYVVNRPNKRIGVQAVDISYANVVSKAADTFPEGFTDSTSYGMYTTNFTLSKSTKLILKQTNKETAEFDYIIISKVTE